MVELIKSGDLRPTAAAVAERAGVSLRLVFHHFKDMEAVLRYTMQFQAEQIASLVPIHFPKNIAFDEKVQIFVQQRATLYEEITPVRRAARNAEPASPSIAEALDRFRGLKREQVAFLFQDELNKLSTEKRKLRLYALQMATSWLAWESLRAYQKHSAPEACLIFSTTIKQLVQ